MRPIALKAACVLLLGVSALLGARTADESTGTRLQLIDVATGKPRAGIVRIFAAGRDKPLTLPGLFDRLRGLERSATVAGWYVVPADGAMVTLPRAKLRCEALAGLETAMTRQEIDLTDSAPKEIRLPLTPIFNPAQSQLAAGNTHLHLRNLTPNESDEYLRHVPAADGLQVMFISYLERHKDDAFYITNRYPIGELKQFAATGVLYGNGEEHRHNFEAYGEGYGHVMFLGIRELVRPVSLGPGITGGGNDDRPLRPGLDAARELGGTIIWCHNASGFEDVPSVLAGKLDALNVFDGSRAGNFAENYYRYLNIGLRMPISTGTDWFVYDFSRVYAQVPGKLTLESWLEALKAGRTVATNGPLLTLQVNGQLIGSTINLEKPQAVRVEGSAIGRHDFGRLQLIHNGKVVVEQTAEKKETHYTSRLTREVRIDTPGWLALHIESTAKNEFGQPLFAQSSPVYVDVAGKRVFDVAAAEQLLRQIEEGRAAIRARANFSTAGARDNLLSLYDEAVRDLKERLRRRGR